MFCLFTGCYYQNNFTKYLNTVRVTWKAIRNWVAKGVCPLHRDPMFVVNFIVLLFTIFFNWCDLLVRKEEANLKPIKFQLFNDKPKRASWRFIFFFKWNSASCPETNKKNSHVAFSYRYWMNNRKVSIFNSCH